MDYDVIIIGAGPGGYVSAIRLGQLGKKVLVIEKRYLGGVCLNEGCIPVKALVYASHLREKVNYAKREMGFLVNDEGFEIEKLRKWKERIVERLKRGIETLFRNYRIDWIMGEGKLIDKNRVEVISQDGRRVFTSNFIIIATGSRPFSLKGFEPDEELIWTSTHAVSLPKIPSKLLILGAGAIGLEFAYIYKNLGSEVEIYEIMPQILPGNDREMAEELRRVLERKGIKINLNSKALRVEKKGNSLDLVLERNGKEERVSGEILLLAVGRTPVLNGIGVEEIGIKTHEKGYIITDAQMRTSISNIFAIGDVTGPPLLAHRASKQGIVAAEVIAGLDSKFEPRVIPNVVYTEPQYASVGISEEEAKDRGIKYSIGRFPFIANGKAVSSGETSGFVKIIGDINTNRILGVHILGPEASSLIGEGLIAIESDINIHEIAESIHPHPSLCEAIMEACENYFKKAIHILN